MWPFSKLSLTPGCRFPICVLSFNRQIMIFLIHLPAHEPTFQTVPPTSFPGKQHLPKQTPLVFSRASSQRRLPSTTRAAAMQGSTGGRYCTCEIPLKKESKLLTVPRLLGVRSE